MKCDLSTSNPCPNDAEFVVEWHMSFDPETPCYNYVCKGCLEKGERSRVVILDRVRPLGSEV